MFGNPHEYRQLNSGAHRRRATNLRAPALTWHLAFWIPASVNPDESRRELKRTLDEFILAYCRTLTGDNDVKGIECYPYINDAIVLFENIASKSTFGFIPDAVPTQRQSDIRDSDYPVVSIRYRWHGLTFTIRVELHTEYFSFTTFVELGTLEAPAFLELSTQLSSLKNLLVGDDVSNAGAALSTYFYEVFWQRLFLRMFSRKRLTPYLHNAIFEHIFADFRSIVLSNETISFELSDREDGHASWGHRAELKFRTLVTSINEYEYTTSYMSGKRALYMSALGPQRPAVPDDERIPLTYLLYVKQRRDSSSMIPINKWQLGRLVDRIHLLGTVRLAALKNFPALRNAGTVLSQLDPLVRQARDAVTAHRTSGQKSDAIECINYAHERFNKITETFAKETGTEAEAGLLYRIEQSRYYVEQFNTNVKNLRLSRVEGCQRYDVFVRRRLGATYDFIDRLGRRYERAISSLSMLDQNYLAIRANKTGSDVKEIQRYADFALIGALVPYYLLGLISHGMPSHESIFMKDLTIGVSSLLFSFGLFRFIEPEKHRRAKKLIGALFAFVAVVSIWLAMPILQQYVDSGASSDRGVLEHSQK
jgi:hypothetical protein